MTDEANTLLGGESAQRWMRYLAKAAVLFVVLLAFARLAPMMPPLAVAICWAALSMVSAIGLTYHAVIRKILNQHKYKSGGLAAGINGGRFFCLILAFVGSAALVGGLVFESSKWGPTEWLVAAAAIPLYFVVYLGLERFSAKELEAPYQKSTTVLISGVIVGVLMCIVYLLLCSCAPVPSYANVTEAFMEAPQPFVESPSVLLAELGKLVAMVDGVIAYGQSVAGEVSVAGYKVWRAVICASAFFAIASLLGVCALEPRELRLVFLRLDAAARSDSDAQPVKLFVFVACLLPALLVVGFLAADAKAAEAVETEEYTAIEQVVRNNVGLVAYMIDGKYVDQQQVEALRARARNLSAELRDEREAVLVPLINAAYDQRIENVDSYLDWYYSLPADYERLLQFFAGTVEEGMRDQLTQRLNENVDMTELEQKFNYYLAQSEQLKKDLEAELREHEIDKVPDWLVVVAEPLKDDFLDKPLAPTQKFLDASERMGLSAGAGVISGIIAAKAAQKVLAKPFFKKIVAELVKKLAVRGLLAEGGTLVAPGIGTAIGVGIGTATDFLLLKADEAMNRESYREEIVAAIEESRQELLDLVSGTGN